MQGIPTRVPAQAGALLNTNRSLDYGPTTPVPDSPTLNGVLVALVAIRSCAGRLPATVVEILTSMVQLAPAANVAGQLFACT